MTNETVDKDLSRVTLPKDDFASMNDVHIVIEEEEEKEEVKEPEEVITVRPVHQQPLLKMVVIGGIVLLFVMLVGAFLNGSINALNNVGKGDVSKPETAKQTEEEIEKIDETGQTKTALAMVTQKAELKKLREQRNEQGQTTPEPEFTPTPVASPQPIPTTAPRTAPAPMQTTAPMKVAANPTPYRTARTSNPPESKPISRSLSPVVKSPVSSVKQEKIDPYKKWEQAANVGSFSSGDSGEEMLEGIEGGNGVNSTSDTELVEASTTETSTVTGDRVVVGSHTEGKLDTPIVWGSGDNLDMNYLIRVTKPLKSSEGNEAIPVGSYIVAKLANTNSSGYAQLYGVSVLINNVEKPLKENSVLIMSKDGSFLKAESKRGNNIGNNIMSAVIAGVAKASEIQNRPRNQTIVNSNGFSSSSTTNEDQNIQAAFTEGAFNNVLDNIKQSNENNLQRLENQSKVYIIQADKTVKIFINQTIEL